MEEPNNREQTFLLRWRQPEVTMSELYIVSRDNTNGKQPLLTSVTSCQILQRMRIDCNAETVASGWRPWIKKSRCLRKELAQKELEIELKSSLMIKTRTDVQTKKHKDGGMSWWKDGQTKRQKHRESNGWMDRRVSGWTYGWIIECKL